MIVISSGRSRILSLPFRLFPTHGEDGRMPDLVGVSFR